MYRVLACLTTQHDYRLVGLAIVICAAASVTSFSVYSRAVAAIGLKRLGWLFLTAVCAAAGIWATHFVAMLTYNFYFAHDLRPHSDCSLLVRCCSRDSSGLRHLCNRQSCRSSNRRGRDWRRHRLDAFHRHARLAHSGKS